MLLEDNRKLQQEVAKWEHRYNEAKKEQTRLQKLMYDLLEKLHSQGFK